MMLTFSFACHLLSVVNWMLSGHYPELDLAATALKVHFAILQIQLSVFILMISDYHYNLLQVLQLVTLCHFHWIQAWRILHRETVAKVVWFPLMAIFSTYIIAVAAIGILDVGPSWTECLSISYLNYYSSLYCDVYGIIKILLSVCLQSRTG